VPGLVAAVPRLDEPAARRVAGDLLMRWAEPEPDWRRWSFARGRARQVVGDAEPALRALAAGAQVSAR
jgi:hypothetical protein